MSFSSSSTCLNFTISSGLFVFFFPPRIWTSTFASTLSNTTRTTSQGRKGEEGLTARFACGRYNFSNVSAEVIFCRKLNSKLILVVSFQIFEKRTRLAQASFLRQNDLQVSASHGARKAMCSFRAILPKNWISRNSHKQARFSIYCRK